MKILLLAIVTLSGLHKAEIWYHGRSRRYLYYIPEVSRFSGLIIGLHGGGGSPESFLRLTRGEFNNLDEKGKFLVVYPEAIGKHWNNGRELSYYKSQRLNVDDVGFIKTLIEKFRKDYSISERNIFIVGMSNGGMMAFRLSCEIPDAISTIGVVASGMPKNLKYSCRFQKVNVIMIVETGDPLIPFKAGYVKFFKRKLGKVISVEELIHFRTKGKHCITTLVKILPDVDPNDGTTVTPKKYFCKDGGKFYLYVVKDGGHTWPGGNRYLPEFMIGKSNMDIDACQEIFHFFEGIVKNNGKY